MRTEQQMVRRFMEDVKQLSGLPVGPSIPAEEVRDLCMELMTEELKETAVAMIDEDLVEIADGLGDLLYVTLYAACAYGIDIEVVFHEIQRSNMTKKGGPKSETGKQLKPPTYEPPQIDRIIDAQIPHPPKHLMQPIAFTDSKVTAYIDSDGNIFQRI